MRIGALIALAALLVLAGCSGGGTPMDDDDARATVDTVNNLTERIESGGDIGPIEAGPDAGPAERVTVASYNIMLRDDRRFLEQATAAGMIALLEFEGVTPSSPILRQCDAMAALEAEADANATHFDARARQIEAAARRILDNDTDHRQFLTGFRRGQPAAGQQYRRNWELNGDIAAAAAGMCRALARGNWQNEGGMPAFTNDRDLADFNRHAALLNTAQTTLNAAVQESLNTSRANMAELERDLR